MPERCSTFGVVLLYRYAAPTWVTQSAVKVWNAAVTFACSSSAREGVAGANTTETRINNGREMPIRRPVFLLELNIAIVLELNIVTFLKLGTLIFLELNVTIALKLDIVAAVQ